MAWSPLSEVRVYYIPRRSHKKNFGRRFGIDVSLREAGLKIILCNSQCNSISRNTERVCNYVVASLSEMTGAASKTCVITRTDHDDGLRNMLCSVMARAQQSSEHHIGGMISRMTRRDVLLTVVSSSFRSVSGRVRLFLMHVSPGVPTRHRDRIVLSALQVVSRSCQPPRQTPSDEKVPQDRGRVVFA